jgi:hypothetical protein
VVYSETEYAIIGSFTGSIDFGNGFTATARGTDGFFAVYNVVETFSTLSQAWIISSDDISTGDQGKTLSVSTDGTYHTFFELAFQVSQFTLLNLLTSSNTIYNNLLSQGEYAYFSFRNGLLISNFYTNTGIVFSLLGSITMYAQVFIPHLKYSHPLVNPIHCL